MCCVLSKLTVKPTCLWPYFKKFLKTKMNGLVFSYHLISRPFSKQTNNTNYTSPVGYQSPLYSCRVVMLNFITYTKTLFYSFLGAFSPDSLQSSTSSDCLCTLWTCSFSTRNWSFDSKIFQTGNFFIDSTEKCNPK